MSFGCEKKLKPVVKEYDPINKFLFDYLRKIIPNYEEKILFSDYGIFSSLEELLIQLEIAIGMDDGRYHDKIPMLIEVLKIRIKEFQNFIDKGKIGYIA